MLKLVFAEIEDFKGSKFDNVPCKYFVKLVLQAETREAIVEL